METQGYYEKITHRVGSINEVGGWSHVSHEDVTDIEDKVSADTVMEYIGYNPYLNGNRIEAINSTNRCDPITFILVSEWLERCREASDTRAACPVLTVAKYQYYESEVRTQELMYSRGRTTKHRLEALEKGIDAYIETITEGGDFECVKGLVHSLVKSLNPEALYDFEETILGDDADGFNIDYPPEEIKATAIFVNDPRMGRDGGVETDWSGHGSNGHIDYFEDTKGNKYCSQRELRAAGVSEMHVENGYQIAVT